MDSPSSSLQLAFMPWCVCTLGHALLLSPTAHSSQFISAREASEIFILPDLVCEFKCVQESVQHSFPHHAYTALSVCKYSQQLLLYKCIFSVIQSCTRAKRNDLSSSRLVTTSRSICKHPSSMRLTKFIIVRCPSNTEKKQKKACSSNLVHITSSVCEHLPSLLVTKKVSSASRSVTRGLQNN